MNRSFARHVGVEVDKVSEALHDTDPEFPVGRRVRRADVQKDFAPVSLVAIVPTVLAIHPSVPARSVTELIALAKAKPGTLNYGSAGNGSANHLAGELFKYMTSTNIVHVPYKGGGPAVVAIVVDCGYTSFALARLRKQLQNEYAAGSKRKRR